MIKSKKAFIKLLAIVCLAIFLTAYAIFQIDTINGLIIKSFSVMKPFIIGFAIAYILNMPISLVKKHLKLSDGLSILSVYLLLIIFISVFSAFVVPTVVESSYSLAVEISKGVGTLVGMVQKIDIEPIRAVLEGNINKIAETLTDISNFIVVNITSVFGTVAATFMNVFFGIIISIYMLIDKQKIIKLFKRIAISLLGDHKGNDLIEHFREANVIFSSFISGLIVESVIVGIIAFIFFTVLGIKYAAVLALIITFTNVIPYVGPFIGAIPAVTATLLYDPVKALWVAIFIAVLQQIDANVIGPRIMGNYIGLDPIWIILSITIGGGFFGVAGILLAIPTAAIIKITLSRMLRRREMASKSSNK